MPRWVALLATVVLLGVAVASSVGAVRLGGDAIERLRFEREDPTTFTEERGRLLGTSGWGPLERDQVRLGDDVVVAVHRQGERPPTWPAPWLLAGEHGAHYVDDVRADGVWIAPAVVSVLALVVALVTLVAAVRVLRHTRGSLDRVSEIVFGQRAPGAARLWFIAGSGGRGGGSGQVPPLPPYDPDWEPDRRIR